MVAAFQSNAFQNNAFQTTAAPFVTLFAIETNLDAALFAIFVLQSTAGTSPASMVVSLSENTATGATAVIERP